MVESGLAAAPAMPQKINPRSTPNRFLGKMGKAAAPAKRTATGVFSLKVTLRNVRPPIWRRILVRGGMTFGDLHMAIQVAMGWQGGHMHAFDVGGQQYGEPGSLEDGGNEERLTLNGVIKSGVNRFTYTYDFGDDWEHDILIEKTPPRIDATAFPACVAGKRNCPPGDCGGPWGYFDLLEILKNPDHPSHEEQREWIGGDFDPEAFSISAADATLATVFRRKDAPATT
jgi:Plasmid pRiA4b ORF-3-like protein